MEEKTARKKKGEIRCRKGRAEEVKREKDKRIRRERLREKD